MMPENFNHLATIGSPELQVNAVCQLLWVASNKVSSEEALLARVPISQFLCQLVQRPCLPNFVNYGRRYTDRKLGCFHHHLVIKCTFWRIWIHEMLFSSPCIKPWLLWFGIWNKKTVLHEPGFAKLCLYWPTFYFQHKIWNRGSSRCSPDGNREVAPQFLFTQ